MPADLVVTGMGAFEVIAGVALIAGFLTTWVCRVIVVHLGATFPVDIVHPSVVLTDGKALITTMEGEFITSEGWRAPHGCGVPFSVRRSCGGGSQPAG